VPVKAGNERSQRAGYNSRSTSVDLRSVLSSQSQWPVLFLASLARDVIYTFRAYATMSVSVCLSVCPSVGSAWAHYS